MSDKNCEEEGKVGRTYWDFWGNEFSLDEDDPDQYWVNKDYTNTDDQMYYNDGNYSELTND